MVSGNFAFLTTTLPSVFDDCRRAESYLTTDPRSACFYSRRAIEELVATGLGWAVTGSCSPGGWGGIRRDTVGSRGVRHPVSIARA